MGKSTTLYVGLDVHKDSIDIATCTGVRDARPEHLGTVGGGLEPVTKALRRLVSRGERWHVVYDAGPCGFVLQRHVSGLGWRCEVIAPSSIVKAPGERTKSDRRDAMKRGDRPALRPPGPHHRPAPGAVARIIARRPAQLPEAVTDIAWAGRPAAPVCAVPALGRAQAAAQLIRGGRRARTHRLRLGDRS